MTRHRDHAVCPPQQMVSLYHHHQRIGEHPPDVGLEERLGPVPVLRVVDQLSAAVFGQW